MPNILDSTSFVYGVEPPPPPPTTTTICFCISYIVTESWKERKNHFIHLARVLCCQLQTYGKHQPAVLLEVGPGLDL